jgi:hypothetical protein
MLRSWGAAQPTRFYGRSDKVAKTDLARIGVRA